MPLFKGEYDVPDELIKELRRKFVENINSDPKALDKYHPDDIEQIKVHDWFVAKFLLHQELNIENALKMVKNFLQYRVEMNINSLKEEQLPQNYFQKRIVMIYNHDKNGNTILVIKLKHHFKSKEMSRLQQQYVLYWLEKAVRSNDWGEIAVLFDCTDAGLQNVDLEQMSFISHVFNRNYPWTMMSFIVYNLPWYLTALWQIIKTWVPDKHSYRIKFVENESVLEYIDKDKLPICMGGTCTDPYD